MKVYLLRHGETEWNVQHRVQGALDSPLTENGIQQAKNAAKRLAKVEFDAAFTSPSPRAYRTAQIIAGPHKGLVIQKENSLREFPLACMKGIAWTICMWNARSYGGSSKQPLLWLRARREIVWWPA